MGRAGCLILAALLCGCRAEDAGEFGGLGGRYRAVLHSPGGELPFGLVLAQDEGRVTATLVNGEERIPVDVTEATSERLVLDFPHYDSRVEAAVRVGGDVLEGHWQKVGRDGEVTRMVFGAERGDAPRFDPAVGEDAPTVGEFAGRWSVRFSSSEDPAVGVFRQDGATVTGTFLTTTGDYRYLAGSADGDVLRLSCFDGAHAFMFYARPCTDGSLEGDFWSRDSWHETFTATRDEGSRLPDGFAEVRARADVALGDVSLPDLDGISRSLTDPAFRADARVLYVFGSWCPNCHDATKAVLRLQRRFGPRGLKVLGIAFEHTDDDARNARQVRRYLARHGADFPVLLVGTSDKGEAARRFPLLERIKSYPTFLFLHEGRVVAVHSGFSGPATGAAHQELLGRFDDLVAGMLE